MVSDCSKFIIKKFQQQGNNSRLYPYNDWTNSMQVWQNDHMHLMSQQEKKVQENRTHASYVAAGKKGAKTRKRNGN